MVATTYSTCMHTHRVTQTVLTNAINTLRAERYLLVLMSHRSIWTGKLLLCLRLLIYSRTVIHLDWLTQLAHDCNHDVNTSQMTSTLFVGLQVQTRAREQVTVFTVTTTTQSFDLIFSHRDPCDAHDVLGSCCIDT